jgi:hypothetical protein
MVICTRGTVRVRQTEGRRKARNRIVKVINRRKMPARVHFDPTIRSSQNSNHNPIEASVASFAANQTTQAGHCFVIKRHA